MKKATGYYFWGTILSLPFTLYFFEWEWDIAVVVSVLIGVVIWFAAKVVQAGEK